MDNTIQHYCLKQAEEIARMPEQEKTYYAERLIHQYLSEFGEQEREVMLRFVDTFFNQEARQLIHNAARDNALWPDRVVEACQQKKQ